MADRNEERDSTRLLYKNSPFDFDQRREDTTTMLLGVGNMLLGMENMLLGVGNMLLRSGRREQNFLCRCFPCCLMFSR